MADETFLLLGGAGLVGRQIAAHIAHDLGPRRIVVGARTERSAREAVDDLRRLFPDSAIEFIPAYGDVFVRCDLAQTTREKLLDSSTHREQLLEDIYGDIDKAVSRSRLAELVATYRPDVIVDAINVATMISYRDAHTAAILAERDVGRLITHVRTGGTTDAEGMANEAKRGVQGLMLAQAIPQVIRHVVILDRAMREAGTRLYLKVGTTGTGGMGLDIPYTHGEDRPSAKLMAKTAVAFAHTGLLFLMARTSGRPAIKEIKPGAMIGYARVTLQPVVEAGQPVVRYVPRLDALADRLTLRLPTSDFEARGRLEVPVVDTGENGVFTRGEFETITAPGQMEFVTPEEIAHFVVMEIQGRSTGRDVIAGLDGTVMGPTYRGGTLRERALTELARLEAESGVQSVALGQLGPPEISKLLWEAELLRAEYKTVGAALTAKPEDMAKALYARLLSDAAFLEMLTSTGAAVLLPDGTALLRGPFLRIPEVPGSNEVAIHQGDLDRWAEKGWVDLRPQGLARWQERLQAMVRSREAPRDAGSAGNSNLTYLFDEILPGQVVAWIFNSSDAYGHRIK